MSKRVLAGLGYEVLSAQTPAEALRVAEAHAGTIAMVVTDVVMPQMGGRELVNRLQAFHPNLKTLYISGYVAEAVTRGGMPEEGVSFLSKPFTPEELANSVRSTLSGREIVVR